MKKDIDSIMKILEKYFDDKKRTTLNRMREPENLLGKEQILRPRKSKSKRFSRKPDAFKILISCLLSLRTQDENTEKVSKKLFAVAETPEKISEIPIRELEELIYSSGHYKKKAKTLKHVSKVLIEKYNSKVPDTKEGLLSIKGIGPKTANIVLGFAYCQSVIPVDVHVHIISNRLGLVKTKKPEDTEKELEKIVPKRYWKELNGIFVLFGKEICITLSPKCSICPIRRYCPRIGVTRSR